MCSLHEGGKMHIAFLKSSDHSPLVFIAQKIHFFQILNSIHNPTMKFILFYVNLQVSSYVGCCLWSYFKGCGHLFINDFVAHLLASCNLLSLLYL